MALNLNLLAGNAVSEKMYNISIDGIDFGKLTESDTEKLISIIKGFQNQSTGVSLNTTNTAPKQSVKQSPEAKQHKALKESKDFPDLGEPTCVLGNITAYTKLVRYWEKGFVPDKVKYGIKMALKTAGAEWNKDKGAFEFKTVKACNDFLKAQKARQSK